jgi:hypothetical protein
MRRSMAIMAGLGIGLISAAVAWADGERPAPQVLVLGQHAAASAPTILRGSAVGPKAAPAEAGDRTQIVAGQRLWLIDRTTGEVQSCINRQTSTVGLREVRCTTAELGGYSRTFGPDFKP